MARKSSSFSSSDKNEKPDKETQEEQEGSERANAKITPAGEPLLMGYVLAPAKIVVEILAPPNVKIVQGVSFDIQKVEFLCPDIDIAPLYLEMKELKEILKKILDTKQLSQQIGNKLVGDTYLR